MIEQNNNSSSNSTIEQALEKSSRKEKYTIGEEGRERERDKMKGVRFRVCVCVFP